jgi:hypothetical protein
MCNPRQDNVWDIEGQLQGHVPAGGAADEVRPLDPEVVPGRPTVGALLRNVNGTRHIATACIADTMIAGHAIPGGAERDFCAHAMIA